MMVVVPLTKDYMYARSRKNSMMIIAGRAREVEFQEAYGYIYHLQNIAKDVEGVKKELFSVINIASVCIRDFLSYSKICMLLKEVFMSFLESHYWHDPYGGINDEAVDIWHLNTSKRLWTFLRIVFRTRVALGRLMRRSRHRIEKRLTLSALKSAQGPSARPIPTVRHSAESSYSSSSGGVKEIAWCLKRRRDGSMRSLL